MNGRTLGIRTLAATLMTACLFTLPAAASYHPGDSCFDNGVTAYNLMLERSLGDPFDLIAATVRDESATYPRPTALGIFCEEPFGVAGCKAASRVDELLQKPQFADIHLFKTSNGVSYLYSDRLMTADWAAAMAEWIEVGSRLPANQ